ncbi:MAG: MOSC N-terminal beta barrel domain-containing protein [Burkholderiaceae bacterium]|nr:MOSC N-terminal beta barrel domain-containing protein [Burkholderiaceae bacterium]
MSDLNCILHALYVHPVKSCAGIGVRSSLLGQTGLELDRAWMLVDERGEFVTQRELPKLALIQPTLRQSDMVLRAPGMLALHLALDRVESALNVRVWNDSVPAWDMGALAAQWCSDFAGRPLRLVRFDPEHRRLSERRWTGKYEAQTAFADAFALLVTSTASLAELNRRLQQQGAAPVDMSRFRPNLVLDGIDAHDEDHVEQLQIDSPQGTVQLNLVKPCARCTIPGVDPLTGVQGFEVIDALAGYRSDPRVDGAVTFGMNAIVVSGVDHVLAVGQTCRASFAF